MRSMVFLSKFAIGANYYDQGFVFLGVTNTYVVSLGGVVELYLYSSIFVSAIMTGLA